MVANNKQVFAKVGLPVKNIYHGLAYTSREHTPTWCMYIAKKHYSSKYCNILQRGHLNVYIFFKLTVFKLAGVQKEG